MSIDSAMFELYDAMVAPVRAAALGYRTQLIEEDTPLDIANEMMKDMHHWLCRSLSGEVTSQEEMDREAVFLATVLLRCGIKPVNHEATVEGIREWASEHLNKGWNPEDGWDMTDGST